MSLLLFFQDLEKFSHLIVASKHKYTLDLKPLLESHSFIGQVDSFSRVKFNYTHFPPVMIESKVAMLQRRNLLSLLGQSCPSKAVVNRAAVLGGVDTNPKVEDVSTWKVGANQVIPR